MTLLRTNRRHFSPTGVRAREYDGHLDGGRPGVRVVVTELPGAARLRARLSLPYPPEQAALLAHAALADTLGAVTTLPAGGVTPGRAAVAASPQDALAGARWQPAPCLLVGTATPHAGRRLLQRSAALLATFDAVLGPAASGGWWVFGLRRPAHAAALGAMPEALTGTGSLALAALRLGLRVAMLPTLTDVTGPQEVHEVARLCPPGSAFAAAVARLAPVAVS